MGLTIKFISTRSNTNNEFYWVTNDPAIEPGRSQVMNIATQMGIPFETTVSEDQLTCIRSYTTTNNIQWQSLVSAVETSVPNNINVRNTYHTEAGHNLKMEIIENDTLMHEHTII